MAVKNKRLAIILEVDGGRKEDKGYFTVELEIHRHFGANPKPRVGKRRARRHLLIEDEVPIPDQSFYRKRSLWVARLDHCDVSIRSI